MGKAGQQGPRVIDPIHTRIQTGQIVRGKEVSACGAGGAAGDKSVLALTVRTLHSPVNGLNTTDVVQTITKQVNGRAAFVKKVWKHGSDAKTCAWPFILQMKKLALGAGSGAPSPTSSSGGAAHRQLSSAD